MPGGTCSAGAEVRLERLTKSFAAVKAVDDLSLAIPSGSFVTLLGPSGSGKTTTLNLVAGFLTPDSGEIQFDGKAVSAVPPHRRNIGMVFQSYALFPHMNVFDNVAYPLRMRERLSRVAIADRVAETLALVRLSGFEDRYPRQLSGGQQQRVSMARAIVSRPRLLLMDEPLGALDKKLREQLQGEIRQIHQTIRTTFLYVTHDQSEALTMSDLVVVMHNSRIAQVGTPRDVYETPVNTFVADFLGGANLLKGEIAGQRDGSSMVRLANGRMVLAAGSGSRLASGSAVCVFVRPEDIRVDPVEPPGDDRTGTPGVIREIVYLGDAFRVVAVVGEQTVAARVERATAAGLEPGRGVFLSWPTQRSRALSPMNEQ